MVKVCYRAVDKSKRKEHQTLEDFTANCPAYEVSESGNIITVKFNIPNQEFGKDVVYDGEIKIEKVPGTVKDLIYRNSTNKAYTKNYLIVSPYNPFFQFQIAEGQGYYFGRLVVDEENNAYLYLRGRCKSVIGGEPYEMPLGESSLVFMKRKFEGVKKILSNLCAKEGFLNDIDPLESLSYLEAQVDLLTRIILNSDIEIAPELKKILKKADYSSILNSDSSEKLLKKMAEKAQFRQKQMSYVSKKI